MLTNSPDGPKTVRTAACDTSRDAARDICVLIALAASVPTLAVMAMEAVHQRNMCVVVGLQSTGEAGMNKALEDNNGEDLNDFVSAPMMIIKHLVETQ
eukprot:1633708-Pyramimonas_sp.AAC.1